MMDTLTLIIILTFISQIITISLYMPFVVRRYSRELVKRYPENEYPRLYPLGADIRIARGQKSKYWHYAASVSCLLIFLYGLLTSMEPKTLTFMLVLALMIQCIPIVVAGKWMAQRDRALQEMPPPTVRSTSLKTRKIKDIISTQKFYLAIAMYITSLLIGGIALSQDLGTETRGYLAIVVIITAATVHFAFSMRKVFHLVEMPRTDPYASTKDVFERARQEAKTIIGASTFVSFTLVLTLLWLFIKASDIQDYDGIPLMLLMSLVAQIGMVTMGHGIASQLNTTDYSVYKNENSLAS
jgi:hypothetical protein